MRFAPLFVCVLPVELLLLLEQVSDLGEELDICWRFGRSCWGFLFLLLELGEPLQQDEDREGDDEEVYNHLDEVTVVEGDSRDFHPIDPHRGAPQRQLQVGEVDPSNQQPERGHEDIVHKGADYLAESSTNYNTDCQI